MSNTQIILAFADAIIFLASISTAVAVIQTGQILARTITADAVVLPTADAVNNTSPVSFSPINYDSSNGADDKSRGEGGNTIIQILGVFELSRITRNSTLNVSLEGSSELFAAKLAVQHVNHAHYLGNYHLQLFVNDSQCDPGVAVDVFFHAIFSRGIKAPILLGPACSDATASLANIVPYWHTVQISHGATSPVLGDRKAFPSFFRVVTSDISHNEARLAFIQHFKWRVVTVISQDAKEYTLSANNLVKMLEAANISCRGTITFAENDFDDQLQYLKDIDTRIIVGSFSSAVAPRIFCKVVELGMHGTDYVWILPKERGVEEQHRWWMKPGRANEHCGADILTTALEGAIFVDVYHSDSYASDTGYSSSELEKELMSHGLSMGRYTRESYDSVWAAAMALRAALPQHHACNQCYTPSSNFSEKVFDALTSLKFVGISGPILFQGADRVGISALQQMQGGRLQTVAVYSPSEAALNTTCLNCHLMMWTRIPIAQRYLVLQVQTISFAGFIAVSTATAAAILLACLFLAFNLYFRKLKSIKLSSPRLNNIAVVGCISVYIAVFLLGLDNATNPLPSHFPTLCAAKIYLFSAGFSLAFGSIFAKTYRIHKIFILSRGGFVKKKYLQDTQLILLVCALLVIDGLAVTTWVLYDPLNRQLRNLTQQVSETDRSVIHVPQIEVCSCAYLHGWLSLIYGYKGVQLVMGVYMAWETRHVKIPALNDSQYIGMSVYGVVITSCIVVVVANVVAERPTVAYVTISVMILTTTTATLSLLFIPKVITVFRRKDMLDPVMQSVGLHMQSNTRRFVTDDAKEKLFRLEVQNRVFKRELLLLRAEIRRLEKQIMSPSSPTISSISMEIASFKVTQADSEESQTFLEIDKPVTVQSPRRSWPSDREELFPFPSFQSDQNLEDVKKIRDLIRTRRIELRKIADKQGNEETKRKFSMARCLQALPDSRKDIVIDLDLFSTQIEESSRRPKREIKIERRYSLFPLMLVNSEISRLKSQSPRSLPELDYATGSDKDLAIKSRSWEDTGKFRQRVLQLPAE